MLNVSFFNSSQVNTIPLIKRANDKLKKPFLLGKLGKNKYVILLIFKLWGVF